MNANKQHPFENDALDARLRRRLTAETPPLRDLWPAVAARLAAPPRRRHTRVAVLAAAAAAALLLMGAAALRGFVIHDWTTGETVELLPGEPYSGDGSDTAMEMHRLAETDPNWRDTIHDDRDEWPETWDKQYCTYDENGEVVSSGTPMLDFLNTAVYGQVLANVTGDARGSAAGMDVAKWPADEEAALRLKLAGTGAALWLPQALPERYEFAHGSITPYFTPAQIAGIVVRRIAGIEPLGKAQKKFPDAHVSPRIPYYNRRDGVCQEGILRGRDARNEGRSCRIKLSEGKRRCIKPPKNK